MKIHQIYKTKIYAFGSVMEGRVFEGDSLGYRFSFNGMEKDDEVKGAGNSLDFGARVYDGRLGRWMSVDPLLIEYPELSPFQFTNNNPILFVDYDGKDYGILVNHSNKTVMIVATIHSTKQDAIDANKAANYWCAQNGKFQIQVKNVVKKGFLGIGRKTTTDYYDIIFDINVKEHNSFQERDIAYEADNSGYGNTYSIEPEQLVFTFQDDEEKAYGFTSEEPRLGRGMSRIIVGKGNQDSRNTGSHEIGHILGLPHWGRGLMRSGEIRETKESEITKGNIRRILSNTGLVKSQIMGFKGDAPIESRTNDSAKFNILESAQIKGDKKIIRKS
jgi:RHS repeat-associated protein